jgi:hypothetical protein
MPHDHPALLVLGGLHRSGIASGRADGTSAALQVAGEVFVFGDGDCGQLGLGEEVTERLRPFPVSVAGKKVSLGCGALEQHPKWHQQHLLDSIPAQRLPRFPPRFALTALSGRR